MLMTSENYEKLKAINSSTLVRASREAESVSDGHGQSTESKGFLLSKGNWNKKLGD